MKYVLISLLASAAIIFGSCSGSHEHYDHAHVADSIVKKEVFKFDISKLPEGSFSYPYELQELGYTFSDLEPVMDSVTVRVHYSKHHQGYVNKTNNAIAGTEFEGEKLLDIFQNITQYPTAVRNSGGGHFNHTLFWDILTPGGDSVPSGNLAAEIEKSFGSYEGFQDEFNTAAKGVFGSGWAWLAVDKDGKLFITYSKEQNNPLMEDAEKRGIPILGIDVWEHAYYLQYKNKRGDYVATFWKLINWNKVTERYENAVK